MGGGWGGSGGQCHNTNYRGFVKSYSLFPFLISQSLLVLYLDLFIFTFSLLFSYPVSIISHFYFLSRRPVIPRPHIIIFFAVPCPLSNLVPLPSPVPYLTDASSSVCLRSCAMAILFFACHGLPIISLDDMTIISSRYDIENNIANIDVGFYLSEISSQRVDCEYLRNTHVRDDCERIWNKNSGTRFLEIALVQSIEVQI